MGYTVLRARPHDTITCTAIDNSCIAGSGGVEYMNSDKSAISRSRDTNAVQRAVQATCPTSDLYLAF